MNIIRAFAETATTGAGEGASFFQTYGSTIFLVIALGLIFYFLMYRPQKKQEKEAAEMKNNLAVGDEITTIGGIIGEVVSIKEDTCVIETTKDKCKIRILKSAISRVDIHASEKK